MGLAENDSLTATYKRSSSGQYMDDVNFESLKPYQKWYRQLQTPFFCASYSTEAWTKNYFYAGISMLSTCSDAPNIKASLWKKYFYYYKKLRDVTELCPLLKKCFMALSIIAVICQCLSNFRHSCFKRILWIRP